MLSVGHKKSTLFFVIILWLIAWRFEIMGGIFIIAFSIYMATHLGVFDGNSTEGLMIITPLAMTGFMFVFIGFRIWFARRAEEGAYRCLLQRVFRTSTPAQR